MFEIGRLTRLALGYESEGNSRPIEICVADWLADWPGATIGLLLMRPGEETYYPAAIKVLDGVLHFTPSRADMAIPGDGLAQIVLTDENDVELRSRVVRTMIECSLPGSGAEAPEEPMRPFVTQVLEAAASAAESADLAGKAAGNAAADAGRAEAAADNAEAAAKRAEEAAGMIGPGGGGTGTVTSVNGVQPDEAGNVEIDIPEPPKKLSELVGDAEHRLVTDTEKAAWDAKSTFSGKYEDLSGKPTITNVPSWALQSTKPTYTAAEVGALPSTYTPPNQTADQVGADPAGTAASKVSTHNADEDAHPAIRQLVSDLSGRLNALADSDDTTLDQLSEIVAYIKSNKALIDSITTGKVSTVDIVNNLTSTATNKPLSAAQGKALKALIDAIVVPTKLSELAGDATHRVVTDAEKAAWNAKSTFSGKYADLTGKPTIPTKVSQLTNDSGYLTKHQDISHLLPRTELDAAVDTALAEAKESGDFDGDAGKSAYQYAKDGGYTGTEADFAAKLAEPAFDPTAYDIPILYLTGSTAGMTKENAVTLTYACEDKDGNAKSGTCTVKWQGSSSLAYAKKNYTIKFDNAFEVVDGWTAQQKYCFKANFIDHSHARNLVSCKLWGQIVKSRDGVDGRLTALPNGGAVDGFPCVIMLNGAFHGLYTWNIPKDGWMFGMPTGSNVQQAIVCGDKYTDATYFKALAALDGTDYELEYCSTSDTSWVKTSFNRMLQAVIDSNGGNIDTVLAKYIDIDSAIDYLIDTVLVQAPDCQAKNTLYVTYDGVKWFMSAYDRDSTFGLHFAGKSFYGLDEAPTFTGWKYHRLMNLLWTYKREAIRTRYAEIRAEALSESNVAKMLWNFESAIPKAILNRDVEKWPSIPSSSASDVHQMMEHYRLRCRLVDEWVKSTSGELEQPSGYTNLVPTSVDASGNVYNSKGYKDGYRMNSSGAEVTETGSTVTGFMACTNADTIRVTGLPFGPAASCGVYGYVSCFDSNKNKIVSTSMDNISSTSTGGTNQGITASNPSGTWGKNNIVTLTFGGIPSTMAYLRISSSIDANAGVQSGSDLIVTKNEGIV